MLSRAHCRLVIFLTHAQLLHPYAEAAKLNEKSRSQSQQTEWPQSRYHSMSVGDAESQCPERDRRLKHQFSNNHQHTDSKAHPRPALLSLTHHQNDRDTIHTAVRILGVRAAKIPVQAVTSLMSFPLKRWQTLTFCMRLECRVVSTTLN